MGPNILDEISLQIQANKQEALQKVIELIVAGVCVENPEQLYICGKIRHGKNFIFDSNVIIEGFVSLDDRVKVDINRTVISEDVYVLSRCKLVAPLKINKDATIASGSTITKEVVANTLIIARSCQVMIENCKCRKKIE